MNFALTSTVLCAAHTLSTAATTEMSVTQVATLVQAHTNARIAAAWFAEGECPDTLSRLEDMHPLDRAERFAACA
jgi:hypothetical protein